MQSKFVHKCVREKLARGKMLSAGSHHLDATLGEFIMGFGKHAKLRSAHWSVVGGVREHDGPAAQTRREGGMLSVRL